MVLPTRNRANLLELLLRDFAAQEKVDFAWEVRVGDDGSTDDTARLLGTWAAREGFELVHVEGSPGGAAAARNRALAGAAGEWIAFVDDDVRLPGDWLVRAGRALRGLGPECSGMEGAVERPGPAPGLFDSWVENRTGGRFVTAHLFARRTAMDRVGGFDERFGSFREDSDLAFRLLRVGPVPFRPELAVRHPVRSEGFGKYLRQMRRFLYDSRLRRRHPEMWGRYIGRSYPRSFALAWVFWVVAVAGCAVGSWVWAAGAAMAALAVPWAWALREGRGRSWTVREGGVFLGQAPWLPFWRLGVLVAGWWMARKELPWTLPEGPGRGDAAAAGAGA